MKSIEELDRRLLITDIGTTFLPLYSLPLIPGKFYKNFRRLRGDQGRMCYVLANGPTRGPDIQITD